jgi:DNA-directed RNA polymerase specialized sigma24 family protein
MLPTAVITSIIQGLLSLDPELRDLVAWRYQGLTYREIAERQGISTQLAEMRHKRALRDWPALAALFPRKITKQARRKGRME